MHLAKAIREKRACLSHNHHDFENLHNLILIAGGHHPGILVVRKDNNPRRDLDAGGIVKALGKLIASGSIMLDNLHI